METQGLLAPAGEPRSISTRLPPNNSLNCPKVGPVLAQRIVDWRTQQGPFKSPEELDAVDGVGPKILETLLPLVTI